MIPLICTICDALTVPKNVSDRMSGCHLQSLPVNRHHHPVQKYKSAKKQWKFCSKKFSKNSSDTFSRYESPENMTIQVSTKVCSFGKQVGQKISQISLTLLHLTNAGGREGRNWILPPGGGEVCLQAGPQPHVRVHGQLHQKAQEPAGEVHDEQRAGELHHPSGETICQ